MFVPRKPQLFIFAIWYLDAAKGPSTPSLDHLVGAADYLLWNSETKRRGCLEINHQFVFIRRQHRQVGGALALENAVHITCRVPVLVYIIRRIGEQTAPSDEPTAAVHGW